ncbi:MAG: hypothetical protein E4H03_12250 [Myxococcales bacterium]|nr:MAG: hypothetical protein E4H03_12250 [Myxococcales bacterium]
MSPESRLVRVGVPALVALVAAVLYLPALGYELVFDDLSLIGPDGPVPLGGSRLPYRPLRYLSLRLDFLLGGGDPWAYHATNLALHAVACGLVVHLVRRLGGRPLVALLAGCTLAVHPLCTEAVAYVSGRRDLLCATLGMAAIVAWISASGRTGVSVLLLLGAVAAKESALVFWAVLVAASRFGFGPALRYGLGTLMFVLPAAVALPVAYGAMGPVIAGGSPLDLLLVAGRTAAHYVGGLVWPVDLSVEYPMLVGTEVCPRAAGRAAVAGLLLLVVSGLTAGVLVRGAASSPAPRPLAFAFCWSTIVLFAIALVIGRHEPGADRHAYPLVAAGSVLAATALSCGAAGPAKLAALSTLAKASMVAWLLLLPFLSLATFERLPVWRSSRALWEATVATTPESVRARHNLAAVLAAQGRHRLARRQLHHALHLQPDYGPARAALAWIACRDGRLTIARRHIEAAHAMRAPFELIAAAEAECRQEGSPR